MVAGIQRVPNLAAIRLGTNLLNILDLSADEKERVGLIVYPDGRLRWKDGEHIWELELQDNHFDFLKDLIEDRNDWRMENADQIESLARAFGIEV
jgi:hypothetical protein